MSRPVIIVTGSSRGIGEAVVKQLLKTATVIGISRSKQPESLATDEHFKYITGDLTDSAVCKKAVDLALNNYNRLDGLVLNAGTLDPVSKIAESAVGDWKRLYNINFFSIIELVTFALPALKKSKGRLVFVSSGAATSHYDGWGAYGSSKAALNHFAATLAAEEKDIFTIALAPGVVDTQMQHDIREKHGESMGAKHQKFLDLKSNNQLLHPDVPATIIANLALRGQGSELNGKALRYNSAEVASYK